MLRKLFVIVTIFTLSNCAEENSSKPQSSGNKNTSSAKSEIVGRHEGRVKCGERIRLYSARKRA